jgi:hypothetical protein
MHVRTEMQWRHMALPQVLKSSVGLLPLYYKYTVTGIVPLPSAYCSTGSDSQQQLKKGTFPIPEPLWVYPSDWEIPARVTPEKIGRSPEVPLSETFIIK